MLVPILLIFPFAYLIFRYKNNVNKFKSIEKIPGPSFKDIINHYRNSSEGFLKFFQSLNTKYGPIVKIWIKPMPPIIMTTDMEFIQKIYKSNDNFYTPAFSEAESLLREGLATTKSRENWHNDKQIVIKTFTRDYISNRLIVYNEKYNEFMEMIYENLEKPIELESNLERIHAEIIIESMMDSQIKITQKEINDYMENRTKYFNLLLEKMNSSTMGILYKFTQNYRLSLGYAENVIEIMENLLERHKKIPIDQREKCNLIYAFIDSGMSDDKIVDNMNTIIGGGFETSVVPLALTLYELAKRPELQEKILEEILSIVGPQSSREITLNDLNNMTYLHCVVNEALRLFFPSPFVDRLLTKDVEIKDMIIPKDTQVIFNLAEIFKSNENFENANVFNPDRFLPENMTENAKKAHLSFGYGAKYCPGKNIAYASMKLFLAKILREFEICSVKDHDVKLKADIMFRSIDGIPVIFQKRMYELYM
nr:cytochrome P450 4C1-like [Onthophagus taurus]